MQNSEDKNLALDDYRLRNQSVSKEIIDYIISTKHVVSYVNLQEKVQQSNFVFSDDEIKILLSREHSRHFAQGTIELDETLAMKMLQKHPKIFKSIFGKLDPSLKNQIIKDVCKLVYDHGDAGRLRGSYLAYEIIKHKDPQVLQAVLKGLTLTDKIELLNFSPYEVKEVRSSQKQVVFEGAGVFNKDLIHAAVKDIKKSQIFFEGLDVVQRSRVKGGYLDKLNKDGSYTCIENTPPESENLTFSIKSAKDDYILTNFSKGSVGTVVIEEYYKKGKDVGESRFTRKIWKDGKLEKNDDMTYTEAILQSSRNSKGNEKK